MKLFKTREVILNGNKVLKRTVGETKQEYEPTITEEKQDRRNEMKAKGTLLMALPNKDQLKFHSYEDAKLLMEAIEKRLQKLISQLEIQGEVITQEDMNLKLLMEDSCFDLEEQRGNRNHHTNNNSNSSTNEADNTTYGVSVAHTQSNPTSGDNLSDAEIHQEEAEIKRHIEIVKDDEVAIDAIPLSTKPPVIVEYQTDKDGRMGYIKLIRADGSLKRYSSMIKMLQNIDREDLETL
ncbi:hypothetical protein Tco_0493356 [Tanacetum coccineum]